MKIRVLRTIRGDAGNVRRDTVMDVEDSYAKSLISRGLAVEVVEEGAKKPAPPKRARGANRPKAKTSSKEAAASKKGE